MDIDASFGYWIRRRRKVLDLTQDALAAQSNCSVTTIRKIEADERRPSRQLAELLAQVLEIDPKEQAAFVKAARSELRVARLTAPDRRASTPLSTSTPLENVPTAIVMPTPSPTTSLLPLPATPLVGRSVELAQMTQLLGMPACRLLTLAGVGGMGKTRLALECAMQLRNEFADGVCFVALAPLSDPEFMVQAIASALGFTFYAAGDPKQHLLNYLAAKELLIVLDNLEHLLAPAAAYGVTALLVDLLHYAPRLKLLVTSRERVNLQDEWVFDLQGLSLPERATLNLTEGATLPQRYSALSLFVQRAQQARRTFALSVQNLDAVVRICQLVDGMPLGIELAASWVHLLSCQEIADEIARTADFLVVTRHDVPARHRSLRAAFDHSWRLLADEERRVLRRLAVFQGGFTREAATQVANATLPLLSALISKSLLCRTESGRYELHELVRQYAYEALCTAQEEKMLRSRHLAYYQQFAEAAYHPLFTAEQRDWVNRLEIDYGNLRAALKWTLHAEAEAGATIAGLRLAGALWLFWWLGAHWREGATWLHKLLSVEIIYHQPEEQRAYQQARARALYGAATLALDLYDVQQALVLAEEGLGLCRAVDDQWGVAFSFYLLGVLGLTGVGDTQQAPAFAQTSATLFRQLNDKRGLSLPLETLGHLARRRGEHKAALRLWEEALRLNRAAGDPMGIAQSSYLLAKAWLRQREYGRARALLEESLAVYHQLGNHFGAAYALLHLGRIAHAQHDYAQARQRYEASQAIFQGLGSKDGSTLLQRGRLALDAGEVKAARALLEQSLALAQETGIAEHGVQAQLLLAISWLAEGEHVTAQAWLAASLSLVQTLADPDYLAQVFWGWARLALDQGDFQRTARLLGVAQALWEGQGLPPAPEIGGGYEQCLHSVRSLLGETGFQSAWATGRAMTTAQAINDVLETDRVR